MQTRISAQENFGRLDVVVEDDDGVVVGRLVCLFLPHAEDLWIAPAHRKRGAVMRHLVRAFRDAGAMMGVTAMIGGVQSPEMQHVVTEHLQATPLHSVYYAIPVNTHG
jgi:hypothetical protein